MDNRAMVNLIKAGCFDSLTNQDRETIMRKYIVSITKSKVEPKSKLTLINFNSIIKLDIIPQQFDFQKRLYNFRCYVFQQEFLVEKNKYILDDTARPFFESHCISKLVETKGYWYSSGDIIISKTQFDRWYNAQMENVKQWLTIPDTIKEFNLAQYNAYAMEVWSKYCKGSISRWEMDSLSFYYTGHELQYANKSKYNITDYNDIPVEPVIIDVIEKTKNNKTVYWDKYQLYKIVGTVLDKDATKHYITLLTTNGVCIVKFYEGQFGFYNKQISEKLENEDKKKVIEKSWFARGNRLLITGIRRGNTFYPKRYYDSMYQHTVCLIEDIAENGDLILKYEKERVK